MSVTAFSADTAPKAARAGAGARGGFSFGEINDYGYYVIRDQVRVHDLHAMLLYAMDLDHEKLTYRFGGRGCWLTDVSGGVNHGEIGSC